VRLAALAGAGLVDKAKTAGRDPRPFLFFTVTPFHRFHGLELCGCRCLELVEIGALSRVDAQECAFGGHSARGRLGNSRRWRLTGPEHVFGFAAAGKAGHLDSTGVVPAQNLFSGIGGLTVVQFLEQG